MAGLVPPILFDGRNRGPVMTSTWWPKLLYVIPITGQRIDDCDLLHREVRNDLNVVLVHDQHFLDAHTVTVTLAVLGLERKRHALLDLDRVVERPDARDHRRIILCKTESVAP